ncbi:putative peptidoglycan glycosyltransferase FtsW [Peptoniphilus equinus]|uniref:Probable peptidoglycan glycosyltransferase FtsW n=1 Tax=Peptoniphilus equinus TaxID=3016343 RepID=A0ABY7QR74_9FIRM|nr:putative peptidoglycan glycosyltransferase FtsW [Peptoniphilus equinus]WBW49269.1 putative peptidoglycan glycosyltransferase FtsW [Peptoniphilus equinus]
MKIKGKKRGDLIFFIIVLLLIGSGMAAVTSASYPEGLKEFSDGMYFAKRYMAYMVVGFAGMFVAYTLPRDFTRKFAPHLFYITIGLMLLVVLGFGKGSHGQDRWFQVPGTSFSFQPSDFIKISSVLFLAKFLSEHRLELYKKDVFFKVVLILGVSVLPVMLKDLSTAVVIGASLMTMYFVAGLYMYQFVTLCGLGVLVLIPMLYKYSYRLTRIFSFFNKSQGALNENYQINQSLYAIAMGGIGGVGYFRSRQKYQNLAEAHNDFIFSVICEEFGMIGGIFILLLFLGFFARGFAIATRSKNYFDKYVTVGLTSFIGIQALMNIGVGIGVFPVTGITLPFISYGGTALIIAMTSAGFILRVSKDV